PPQHRARRVRLPGQAGGQRIHRRRAAADQGIHPAPGQEAAGGRGRRRRAPGHRGADPPRRRGHRHRRQRRRGAGGAGARALRLRGARPEAAGHDRLRAARPDPGERGPRRTADRGVHRQGAQRGGGPAAEEGGQVGGDQGRGIARAPSRRDRAVPAPGGRRPAAGQAAHVPAPARIRRGAARQAGAGGGRRRAQHLRPVQRARAPRHGGADRGHRPGGDREGRPGRRHRPGADGYHDAGHGRLRHDARHPRGSRIPCAADHRPDRQGDEGRPREVPRGRGVGLPGQAGGDRPAPGSVAAVAAPLTSPGTAAQEPVNILLVDDQPGRLLTYRAILEPLGERLVDASSGEEALRLLMEDEYAVILLDVNMPGIDGFETASLIHQHPRFERVPIIFVTAVNVTDMDRLRGYKLGAVDYVMVPVIPEILRSKVVVLAELFRKRRELQQANAGLAAERARELDRLNDSLRIANAELAARNQELHREVGERARAEQRLRFLADTIPSIVWTCAPDGTVTYANRHWYEYYGRPADGAPAHLTRLLLHPDDSDEVRELVTRSLAGGEKFEFEARHRAHDGDYCWYMPRAVPWRDEHDNVTSWFGISTSVHEMKQLMEQLQEADRRKDEFLATLAHELRNPLAPLLNALNVRRISNPAADADPLQGLMERQLSLLVRLIDDLMDVARITRGKLVLRPGQTHLRQVLDSAVETARPQLEQGRHELALELPDGDLPLRVDEVRLSQVFANLLNNASKY